MEQGAPWSEHTEIAILGACLLDVTAINDALEHLVATDFFLDSHRKIYTIIMDLVETGNTVGFIEVHDELARRKELEAVGGPAYLAYLTEGIPRNLNIESYVRIVKDKSTLRRLMALGNALVARAADNSETAVQILPDFEEQMLELMHAQISQGFETMLDAIKVAGGVDQYLENICDPKQITGLATGFVDFDEMTGGLQPGTLIIIAARPAVGKSAWAINVATNIALKDGAMVVVIFSLEMSREAFYMRMLASTAAVNARKAQHGHLGDVEKGRLSRALLAIADKHILIDDTAALSTIQMRAKCRRVKQKMGRIDLVIIDYLQLARGGEKHANRQEEVSAVSRGLKALSKELKVPVVALSQVSRQSEQRGDKRPMLSDLRESGAQEADADIVAFLHREEMYKAEDDLDVERGVAELIVAKNREGATGTRKLAYQADITRFSNLHISRGATSGEFAY